MFQQSIPRLFPDSDIATYHYIDWCIKWVILIKGCNYEIQIRKSWSFSKKKFDSFFDFHTKSWKHQNRGMQLVSLILGFGGWNFASDSIMKHIIDFLIIKLDIKEKVQIPNTLLIRLNRNSWYLSAIKFR
jgi:hypothetical protein